MGNLARQIGCFLLLLALLPSVRAGARSVPMGQLQLGASPLPNLFEDLPQLPFPLGESPREARQIKSATAARTWQDVLSLPEPADLGAIAVLYKWKLVTVELSSSTISADLVRASLVSRYGKGVQQKVEESVPVEGCDPWGLHYWDLSNGTNLYLVTGKESKGVLLQARDVSLYRLMKRDPAVHIEHEQCIEF